MIASYPRFSKLTLKTKHKFDELTRNYEPYAEFSFPCIYSWDVNNSAGASILNGNLVIRMPDYETNQPFYSFVGESNIDETLNQLLRKYKRLEMVPEVVVEKITNKSNYTITEDRDQHDYVYLLKDQVDLAGKDLRNRRKKSKQFFRTNVDALNVKKINFKNPDEYAEIKKIYANWVEFKGAVGRDSIEHEKIALKRLFAASSRFNLMGLKVYLGGVPVGFSICEVLNDDYAVCRFHKSVLRYPHLDAFFSNLVASELKHYGCKYLSWEQDLGLEGLRKFKESYHPVKFLKKYTITKA